MPSMKRHKTKYPGVFYIEGKSIGSKRKERIYYIIYRKDGKKIEEKAGRQFMDAMTPARAARIRSELISGKRSSQRKIRQKKGKEQEVKDNEQLADNTNVYPNILEEKWFLFMQAATDGFVLFDSRLNLLEINDATIPMLPVNVEKENIIGKHISEFAPQTESNRIHDLLMKVVRTGEPLFIDDWTPPYEYRPNARMKIRAFKVGDDLGMTLSDITEYKIVENSLRKRESELERKNTELEEANIALKVILKKREADKTELEEKTLFNVKELVLPIVDKMKTCRMDDKVSVYLKVLESNLSEVISPFAHGLSSKYLDLTPGEIQVANLIKRGESTKEIAELLNSTPRAIKFHRSNIRKKLGLKKTKQNLRTFLLSIQ